MKWRIRRSLSPAPSPEADAAVEQADRALIDARCLGERFERAAKTAAEIRRVNHIAAAVAKSIRGA